MMSIITTASASYEASEARSRELEAELQRDPGRFRVLTGDRPTGPLHLGHLFGTLANRVRLQDLGVDVMVLVADYQTITDRESPASLPADVLGLIADYLAVGIDPERATIFAHSQVEALNQLMLPFLSLVSVAEVSRNPTVKDEFASAGGAAMSALMFTYPVHQAADILFCHANLVPVGLRPASAHRADKDDRAALQRSLLAGTTLLPRARRPAQRRAADPRDGWAQDEQEPRQRDRAGGKRG